jgi:hypothetical protein
MRLPRPTPHITRALALLVLAACGDSTSTDEPDDDFSGTFRLTSISNTPLPFVTGGGFDGGTRIASGTLTVLSRNRVREVLVYEYYSNAQGVQSTARDSGEFAYSRRSDIVVIQRPQRHAPDSYADTVEMAGSGFLVMTRKLKSDVPFNPSGRYRAVYANIAPAPPASLGARR